MLGEPQQIDQRYRNGDHAASEAGAADVSFRASSQKAKLLLVFRQTSELTDEEAAEAAGLNMRSCFWKRCGELRALGLIEFTGGTKVGSAGSSAGLSELTAAGWRMCRKLEPESELVEPVFAPKLFEMSGADPTRAETQRSAREAGRANQYP